MGKCLGFVDCFATEFGVTRRNFPDCHVGRSGVRVRTHNTFPTRAGSVFSAARCYQVIYLSTHPDSSVRRAEQPVLDWLERVSLGDSVGSHGKTRHWIDLDNDAKYEFKSCVLKLREHGPIRIRDRRSPTHRGDRGRSMWTAVTDGDPAIDAGLEKFVRQSQTAFMACPDAVGLDSLVKVAGSVEALAGVCGRLTTPPNIFSLSPWEHLMVIIYQDVVEVATGLQNYEACGDPERTIREVTPLNPDKWGVSRYVLGPSIRAFFDLAETSTASSMNGEGDDETWIPADLTTVICNLAAKAGLSPWSRPVVLENKNREVARALDRCSMSSLQVDSFISRFATVTVHWGPDDRYESLLKPPRGSESDEGEVPNVLTADDAMMHASRGDVGYTVSVVKGVGAPKS